MSKIDIQHTITLLQGLKGITKEVHWNASGPGFLAVHKHLDVLYADTDAFVDEFAEYMVASGYGYPRWTLGEFETFPQVLLHRTQTRQGVQEINEQLSTIVDYIDDVLADPGDDSGLADIYTRLYQTLNKHLWLLSREVL